MKRYIEAGVSFDLVKAEKIFKLKIMNKKFKIEGDTIIYLNKSERD
jgi:hypothetical protein